MRLLYNGIFADMEPSRTISEDGLYNSIRLDGTENLLTNYSNLSYASNFFISLFVKIDSANTLNDEGVIFYSIIDINYKLAINTETTSNYDSLTLTLPSNGGTNYIVKKEVLRSNGVPVISYDEWHHIVVTGSKFSNIQMFIDGVLEDSTAMPYDLDFLPNLTFGSPLSTIFDMDIACLNISINKKLNSQEVASLSGDDGSGGIACKTYYSLTNQQKSWMDLSVSLLEDVPYTGSSFINYGNSPNQKPTPRSFGGSQLYSINEASPINNIFNVNSANLNDNPTQEADQWLEASDNTAFDATTALSVGGWFKINGTSGFRPLINKYGSASGSRSYNLTVDNADQLRFQYSNDGTSLVAIASHGVQSGEIYFIVGTIDGSNIKLYVNGIEVDSVPATASIYNSSNKFQIGNYFDDTYKTNMETFQPFVVKQALTESEIQSMMNGTKAICHESWSATIKGYFENDNGELWLAGNYDGNAGQELIGQFNGINLTAIGNPDFDGTGLQVECGGAPTTGSPDSYSGLQAWIDGETGYSDKSSNSLTVTNNGSNNTTNTLNGKKVFTFDGVNDYFSYGTQLGNPSNFTVFALIKTDTLSRKFAFGTSDSGGASASLWGNCIISQVSTPAGSISSSHSDGTLYTSTYTGGNALNTTDWYILAITYTDGDIGSSIWVNGVEQPVAIGGTSATSNSGTAYEYSVGRLGAYSGLYFNGDIAEHFVYSDAKTDEEIAEITAYLQDKYALI